MAPIYSNVLFLWQHVFSISIAVFLAGSSRRTCENLIFQTTVGLPSECIDHHMTVDYRLELACWRQLGVGSSEGRLRSSCLTASFPRYS